MSRGSGRRWADELARAGRVEIGLSRRRLVLLAFLSAVFVLVGLAMAGGGDTGVDRSMGWLAVVLFGVGLVHFVRQAWRRGPAVVVDAFGITAPRSGLAVPWDAALGTDVFSHRGTHLVQVVVEQEHLDRYYADHPVHALARTANKRLTGGVESLSLPSPLAADAEDVAAWLAEEISRRR